MASKDWPRSTRPVIMGTRHMVSAGHYLAAAAGSRILEAGGNAVDAGVAAGLCINVTQADLTNIGGVAPLMMYLADSGTVETISGLGWWPKAATIDFFQREQGGRIRRGVNRCVLPSGHRCLADGAGAARHDDLCRCGGAGDRTGRRRFPHVRRDAGHPVHAERAGRHAPVALDPQRLLTRLAIRSRLVHGWCRRTSPTRCACWWRPRAGRRAVRPVSEQPAIASIPATSPSAWCALRASRAAG